MDMDLKDKLDYIEIVSKMILNFVKDYPDVEDFMLKNKKVYTDKSTDLSVEITLKREMWINMGFEKNIYQKQHQLLMDTRLRAEEQYKKLLARYVNLWGTAIGSITYGKLICVGEIMGYTTQDVQADIDRKRDAKYGQK